MQYANEHFYIYIYISRDSASAHAFPSPKPNTATTTYTTKIQKKMPEVIDLLSSSPPLKSKPAAPEPAPASSISSPRPPLPTTTTTSTLPPQFTFSDEIDTSSLFAYDDLEKLENNIDNPAKKRRVSGESADLKPPQPPQSKSSNPFQFSDDLDEFGLPPAPGPSHITTSVTATTTGKGAGSGWNVEDSDPIVFTSSAPAEPVGKPPAPTPAPQRRTTFQRTDTITIDSDDVNDGYNNAGGRGHRTVERRENIEELESDRVPIHLPGMDELVDFAEDFCEPPSKSKASANSLFSNRTASLLASLEDSGGTTSKKTKSGRSRKGNEIEILSDDDNLLEPPQPKRKTNKPTSQDKEAKARDREAAKMQREHEKQLEKDRKAKAKEDKAKEKQLAADLAQANKSKINKKESTPDMIVDMASSLEASSVGNQAVEFMRRLGVEHTFFESSIPGIVKWRRKVKAAFNEALGYWEPCQLHIQQEKHVLCLLTAQELVDMVIAPPDLENLEMHVLKMKSAYPGCKPIYLIEGLTSWMRKNHNAKNRAYQAELRRQFDPSSSTTTSSSSSRKKPETTPPIDDDTLEDALLNLQVTHACLIHHTAAAPESAEWLKTFTEHVSTIPYRLEVMQGNDSAFCMDVGQVKAGEDQTDTFVKMLQEINRVTASMAYGIVAKYPTVGDLVEAMKRGGPGLLEDVKVCSCVTSYSGLCIYWGSCAN